MTEKAHKQSTGFDHTPYLRLGVKLSFETKKGGKMKQELENQRFQLEGEFIGFVKKSGKKHLRLAVGDRKLKIKLAKKLRQGLVMGKLAAGDRVRVSLENKLKDKSGKVKLKAVNLFSDEGRGRLNQTLDPTPKKKVKPQVSGKKGKILICQKSGCLKRGGKKLYKALEKTICRLGLENQVIIEATSCQKRCKKAPNMVLMPDKVKYSNIESKELDLLLEKHYLINQS